MSGIVLIPSSWKVSKAIMSGKSSSFPENKLVDFLFFKYSETSRHWNWKLCRYYLLFILKLHAEMWTLHQYTLRERWSARWTIENKLLHSFIIVISCLRRRERGIVKGTRWGRERERAQQHQMVMRSFGYLTRSRQFVGISFGNLKFSQSFSLFLCLGAF